MALHTQDLSATDNMPVGSIPDSEYNALYDLYSATNGDDWIWTASLGNEWQFTEDANPCADDWQGITCYNTTGPNNVVALSLSKMNLVGTIPESVGALTHMSSLQMDANILYYTIPNTIYTLTNLTLLVLESNRLDGTVSNNIGNLTKLERLSLRDNALTGIIPEALSNLPKLYFLDLGKNILKGTIPSSLSLLPKLQYFDVGNNQLTGSVPDYFINAAHITFLEYGINYLDGTLPESYGDLVNVKHLSFYTNYFTGTVPAAYKTLTQLTDLFLGKNDLSGEFPSFIVTFINATTVDLSYNSFNGTIPNNIGNLERMRRFYAFNNFLTGTIPSSFGQMNELYIFDLGYNELTGTIPASLGYKSQLQYFEVNDNYLSGSIPDTLNFPIMYIFDVSLNSLDGTIPSILGSMTQTVYFYIDYNFLTGTIPDALFTSFPELYAIDIGSNYLTGTLPQISYTNTPILQFMDVFSNYFTSTLPELLGTLTSLQYMYANTNQFTGSIPKSLSGMAYLEQINLCENFLTGTIPSDIGNIPYLEFVDFDSNILTGTVPISINNLYYLIVLFLYQNKLTGTLDGVFNASNHLELATIVLNNNQLSGTIPEEIFRLPSLNSFGAVTNCFRGKFPANMCNATTLNSLALDGLRTASNCRNTLFPGLSSSYIVTSSVSSTVPACLFSMPLLTTLHLSGNGLTGSLPDVHITPLLIDLALSHNVLTGTIPARYQRRQWYNLDLSYNRFTGSLLSEFESQLLNSSFYAHLSDVTGLNITAATAQSSLSLEDNRLSGRLPGTVQNKQNVSVLGSNVFSCDLRETDLPVHDSGRAYYQCGSDSFNVPFYIWLISILLVLGGSILVWRYRSFVESVLGIEYALANIVKWQSALQVHQEKLDPARRLVAYQGVMELSKTICMIGARCSLYTIVILLPLYTISSLYRGTLLHQYAWTISAAYLTGEAVTALMFVSLIGLVILALVGYSKYSQEHTGAALHDSQRGPSHKKSKLPSVRTVLIYGGFICLNLIAVVGANVAYVYVAIYGKSDVLLIAQLSLSCFKLFWNRFFSVYLIRWTARLKSMTEQRLNGNSIDTSASGRTPTDRNSFVTLQLFVSLLNNIAVPCLAVAGISPSCFYNLFVGAPLVSTQFTYKACTYVTGAVCTSSAIGRIPMSYKPPFTYNYQCSSSFITYYAPTFVFMCILRAFLSPVLQWMLYYLHRDATPGTHWHGLLDTVLLMNLRPVTSAADIRIDVYRPYFDANQMLLSLFTYTGLLLTFGAVFPPVALALLVTLVSIVYFNQLKVGRLLSIAAEKGLLEYVDVIESESRRAGFLPVLQRVVWMLITVSCWFYTLFLFDTLGDAVGFEGAYWVLIVVPLMPLVIYGVYRTALLLRGTNKFETNNIAEPPLEMTHNALQDRDTVRETELTLVQEKI